jgi:hypothetical protein
MDWREALVHSFFAFLGDFQVQRGNEVFQGERHLTELPEPTKCAIG